MKINIVILLLLATACDNLKTEVNQWANKNSLRGSQNSSSQPTTKISSVCPRGSVTDTKASSESKKMCRTHAGTLFPASEAFQEYYVSGSPKTLLVYTGNNLLRVNWYENGKQKEEINYLDNKKEGPWKSWHENGQLKETGTFILGKKSGVFTNYYETGQIKEKAAYHNDQKNGMCVAYNSKGIIINRETFANDVKHGNAEYFFEDSGKLSSHGSYAKGYYYSRWINYNQNGTIASIGNFNQKGQKDGEWKFFDIKGNPSSTEYFANGEVSKKLELQASVSFNNRDTLGGVPPNLKPQNRYKVQPQATVQPETKGWQPL